LVLMISKLFCPNATLQRPVPRGKLLLDQQPPPPPCSSYILGSIRSAYLRLKSKNLMWCTLVQLSQYFRRRGCVSTLLDSSPRMDGRHRAQDTYEDGLKISSIVPSLVTTHP
jgi:hypothetical protein